MFLTFKHCFLNFSLASAEAINLLNFEFITNYYEARKLNSGWAAAGTEFRSATTG